LDGTELPYYFRTTIAFAQQLAPPITATDAGVGSHGAVGRIVIRRSPTEAGYAHRAARCADPLGYNPPYALSPTKVVIRGLDPRIHQTS